MDTGKKSSEKRNRKAGGTMSQDNMTHKEWLENRKNGIGGSDAAAILGMNPYKTNIALWEEKTGQAEAEDISHKPFVIYGKEAEEPLAKLFALDFPKYEVKHMEYNSYEHPQYPFLIGSLDGQIVERDTGRIGVLEIKTTNILNSRHKEKWNDRIPQNYFIQVLHYLLVTGYDFAVLKAQLRSEFEEDVYLQTKHYHIERKDVEEDIKYLLEKELEFWNRYVVTKKKPPLTLPEI